MQNPFALDTNTSFDLNSSIIPSTFIYLSHLTWLKELQLLTH